MNEEQLNALAREYMKIWSARNAHVLDKHAHPSIVANYTHFEKPYKGIEDYKKMLEITYNFFPDLTISIHSMIPTESEQKVTVEWTYEGTHQNGQLFGVEATGKTITVSGITMLEMNNGLVIKETGIVDHLSMLTQLGALTK